MRKLFIVSIFVAVLSSNIFAAKGKDLPKWKVKTESVGTEAVGINAGNIGVFALVNYSLPSGDVVNVLNGGLGFGLGGIYRDFFFKDFSLKIEGEYNQYTGKYNSAEYMTIIEAKLLGRYDFIIPDTAGVFFLEAGCGLAFEGINIAGAATSNNDALYCFGLGYEFNISNILTMQVGARYTLIPQKYISGASRDGSFIKLNIVITYIICTCKAKEEE